MIFERLDGTVRRYSGIYNLGLKYKAGRDYALLDVELELEDGEILNVVLTREETKQLLAIPHGDSYFDRELCRILKEKYNLEMWT